MKKYSAIISALFLVACTATKTATVTQTTSATPSKTTVAQTSAIQPLSVEQLNHGKELYTQHCSTCHNLKRPTSESAKEWKEIVPDMVAKANKKRPNEIDANTEKIILDYLVAMSTSENNQ